ncbi:MAG: CvpA family protein [Candidatus Omnitrophica bacterium]|nr:CvpA family protein [Candidatus Omnitrophota bacterium]
MTLGVLKQLNWVDILFIIVLIRICYAAVKSGFLAEFFKILGTVFATFLSLHYCTALTDYVKDFAPLKPVSVEFLDLISYLILAIVGYLVFVVLRIAILRFVKMEAVPKLDKWGAFILGFLRGFLLNSLIVFALITSTIPYLKHSAFNSYSGETVFKIAPSVYSGIWNSFASKFMTNDKFNESILEAQPK